MHPLKKSFLCTAFVVGLILPANIFAQSPESQVQGGQESNSSVNVIAPVPASTDKITQVAASELPDSPGAAWMNAQTSSQQDQNSAPQAVPPPASTQGQSEIPQGQDPNQKPQRPVGTAAAEAPRSKGVTAAQPSGVAIAPAKQRRVRTLVIRVGAIVAAGAAIGAVIGLAEATPSRPPGAH